MCFCLSDEACTSIRCLVAGGVSLRRGMRSWTIPTGGRAGTCYSAGRGLWPLQYENYAKNKELFHVRRKNFPMPKDKRSREIKTWKRQISDIARGSNVVDRQNCRTVHCAPRCVSSRRICVKVPIRGGDCIGQWAEAVRVPKPKHIQHPKGACIGDSPP